MISATRANSIIRQQYVSKCAAWFLDIPEIQGCDGVGRGGLSNETRSGGGCGAPISEPFGGRGVRDGTYPTLLIVCPT
jgi:hypothetical protein